MRYDAFREEFNGYDTAQICVNGHTVTEYARSQPEHTQKFCAKCGAETISSCPSCNHFIRGFFHMPGDLSMTEYSAPSFCHNCGKPYPWTETGIKAAKTLISESEKLTAEEKETLNRSLDDIVRDTPNTQVAVIRFKKFLPKTGREVADAVRSIVVDIASEAAKKLLWPS
jgi:hypothetical protein